MTFFFRLPASFNLPEAIHYSQATAPISSRHDFHLHHIVITSSQPRHEKPLET